MMAVQNVARLQGTVEGIMGGNLSQNGAAAESPSVKVSVSYGDSRQESHQRDSSVTHHKSSLTGRIKIVSTEGKAVLEGTDVTGSLAVDARDGIDIFGVKDRVQNRYTNKSQSTSVGVFVGFNGNSYGIGLEGSHTRSRAKTNSDSETWQNSQLNLTHLSTKSERGKLVLDAANIDTKGWKNEVQGLEFTSRQDKVDYFSKQSQMGVRGSVVYGSGGSVGASDGLNQAELRQAQVNQHTNQQARTNELADPNKPTLIANKMPMKNGVPYPNANMADDHAEIGVIQQAYEKGITKNKDMVIHVIGKDVCDYCKKDIALARKSRIKICHCSCS